MPTPESIARQTIDQKLTAAGWIVQDFRSLNLGARIPTVHRVADNVLSVERKAVGAVESQTGRYNVEEARLSKRRNA